MSCFNSQKSIVNFQFSIVNITPNSMMIMTIIKEMIKASIKRFSARMITAALSLCFHLSFLKIKRSQPLGQFLSLMLMLMLMRLSVVCLVFYGRENGADFKVNLE